MMFIPSPESAYFMSRDLFISHSALPPDVLCDTLRRTVDEEQRTLLFLSGFKGDRPLVGKIAEDRFRLRKRRSCRNDFARLLYGRVSAEGGGSRIEARFDLSWFTKNFMRAWFALLGLLGTTLLAINLFAFGLNTRGLKPALIRLALVLFAFLLMKIGQLLSKGGERYILQYLEENLAARQVPPT